MHKLRQSHCFLRTLNKKYTSRPSLLAQCVLLFSTMLLHGVSHVSASASASTRDPIKERPAPATRIVALAPHLVEMAYAVGLGDRLVAAVSYSDFPAAAKQLPRVGNYSSLNIEAIVRLKPDLILAWRSGNPEKALNQLEALGIKVLRSEPKRLDDIANLLKRLALYSEGQAGSQAARDFEQQLGQLRERYEQRAPVTVFYQVWNKPLQTLSGQSIVNDVIELCGGRNVFADAKSIAPKLSEEALLRLDPEAIVASGMGEEKPEWLDDWRAWPQLQAVKKEQLFFVPPDIIQRHSPRLLQGASMLCKQLESVRAKRQTSH